MCQECVIEVSPDRGNVTVESGFYPLNMKKCKNCQTFSTPKTTDYVNEETEDSSSITITYNRNIFTININIYYSQKKNFFFNVLYIKIINNKNIYIFFYFFRYL